LPPATEQLEFGSDADARQWSDAFADLHNERSAIAERALDEEG